MECDEEFSYARVTQSCVIRVRMISTTRLFETPATSVTKGGVPYVWPVAAPAMRDFASTLANTVCDLCTRLRVSSDELASCLARVAALSRRADLLHAYAYAVLACACVRLALGDIDQLAAVAHTCEKDIQALLDELACTRSATSLMSTQLKRSARSAFDPPSTRNVRRRPEQEH
jgi:hypothetical protein